MCLLASVVTISCSPEKVLDSSTTYQTEGEEGDNDQDPDSN